MNENNVNALNPQTISKNNVEIDKNGVMNLTTKTNHSAFGELRGNAPLPVSLNNGMSSNFSCNEPIIFQPQMILPNCNFIKYDLIPEQPNGLVNTNFQSVIAYNNHFESTCIPSGNISQSDIHQCIIQPPEGLQYLHFMMNNGFATADLSNNFGHENNNISAWQNFGFNNITSMMCVEAPIEKTSELNGNPKKKNVKSEVPPFLKRNRTKSKESDMKLGTSAPEKISCGIPDNSEIVLETVVVEDEDDVIFMGEYKSTEDLNQFGENINMKTEIRNEPVTNSSNNEDILDDIPLMDRLASISSINDKKRKRTKIINPTRRNPKRRVQIEKKSIELAIKLSEMDDFKKPVSRKSFENNQVCRRSTRQLAATGAIYIPPNPLTSKDFKTWPVHGMHERPEYDPVKSVIHPFDYTIRSIEESAKRCKTTAVCTKVNPVKTLFNSTSMLQDIHNFDADTEVNILRYVIGFIVQKKKLRIDNSITLNDTKADTDTISFSPQVNKILFSDCKSKQIEEFPAKIATSSNENQLKEILYNCCLLYCLSNNVNQCSLANYLMDFDADIAIDWLNKQILQEGIH